MKELKKISIKGDVLYNLNQNYSQGQNELEASNLLFNWTNRKSKSIQ